MDKHDKLRFTVLKACNQGTAGYEIYIDCKDAMNGDCSWEEYKKLTDRMVKDGLILEGPALGWGSITSKGKHKLCDLYDEELGITEEPLSFPAPSD